MSQFDRLMREVVLGPDQLVGRRMSVRVHDSHVHFAGVETAEQRRAREARERDLAQQAMVRELARLEEQRIHAERIETLLDLGPPSGTFLSWERQYEKGGKTYTYAAVRVDREDEDGSITTHYYTTAVEDKSRKGMTYEQLVEKHLVHATEGSLRKLTKGKAHTKHNAV